MPSLGDDMGLMPHVGQKGRAARPLGVTFDSFGCKRHLFHRFIPLPLGVQAFQPHGPKYLRPLRLGRPAIFQCRVLKMGVIGREDAQDG